jgi:hypothetical protein
VIEFLIDEGSGKQLWFLVTGWGKEAEAARDPEAIRFTWREPQSNNYSGTGFGRQEGDYFFGGGMLKRMQQRAGDMSRSRDDE